jgi:hypothetical protein
MNPPNRTLEEHLEHLVHEALRQLPPCRAPASLEARVLSEVAARAAQSHRAVGIDRWPLPARLALMLGCVLCIPLAWVLVMSLRMQLRYTLTATGALHVLHGFRGVSSALLLLAELAAQLARRIPGAWLFGGLLAAGALYAALCALGYLVVRSTAPHSKVHSV